MASDKLKIKKLVTSTALGLYFVLAICYYRRMYLRWSARVAQFLFNQACILSLFWLTGCPLQRRTMIGFLIQRLLNWLTFWAVCSLLFNTSPYLLLYYKGLELQTQGSANQHIKNSETTSEKVGIHFKRKICKV